MSKNIVVSSIVAMAENRVIGRDNDLPWRLPEDLKYFKRVTMGHPIIMGRKTFESIGRPLPGRANIVVTRQNDWFAEGVERASSLEEACAAAIEIAEREGADEVHIIGGAQLYQQSLNLVSRLYLTQVHAEIDGDAYFPAIDFTQWSEVSRESHSADQNNPYKYSFIVYEFKN